MDMLTYEPLKLISWQAICLFETSHILTPGYLKSLALAQGDGVRQNQSSLHRVDVFIQTYIEHLLYGGESGSCGAEHEGHTLQSMHSLEEQKDPGQEKSNKQEGASGSDQ